MRRPAPSPVGSFSGTTPLVATLPSKRYSSASSSTRERHEATTRLGLSKLISSALTPAWSAASAIFGSPASTCGSHFASLKTPLGSGLRFIGCTPSCF